MNASETIEFVLHQKVEGADVTPRTIGFSQFNEFNRQVEEFLSGSARVKLADSHVEILEGSYKLRVFLPASAFSLVEPDLRQLRREDVLGDIDPRRADILAKWQNRSKRDKSLAYEIRSPGVVWSPIRISPTSDFRVGAVHPWVSVEKYLFGTVVDMGGAQKANIHLRLDAEGRIVKIGSSQAYLEEQDTNRLYRKVLLHVRAEQHHRTGDLRNLQLIAFVDYTPVYDEDVLDRFAAIGREAWYDVEDAAAWVRELRGGD